jgi:hypothetical protein
MSGVALDAQPQPPAARRFWKHDPELRAAAEASAVVAVGAAARVPRVGSTGPVADRAREDDVRVPGAPPAGSDGGPPGVVGSAPVVGVVVPVPARVASAAASPVELRVELAPHVILSLSVVDESVAISPADVRALRAAAAPLVAELASRRITPHLAGDER